MRLLPQLTIAAVLLVQSAPEQVLPLTINDQIVFVTESAAQREREALVARKTLTKSEGSRLAALELALGSIPDRCTVEQARARLCLLRSN